MHKSKLKQMTLAVSLACFTLYAEAAGLGKLTVLSGLGEPLNAEIEVESAAPDELGSLSAAVASPEAYAVQGLPRGAIQENVQIAVSKKANGTPILKLTSSQPVNDPFLDMLIQVDWSTGRLVREYTLLLDPPGYNADAVTPSSPAVVNTPTAPSKSSAPVSKPVTEAVITENGIQAMPEKSADKAPVDEHKTQRGDTLSKIAKEMQVEGVSLDRMLVGLYRENKDAFVNGNMNQLKVGQIIKLPSTEQLNSISHKEAAQEIKVQAADWNGYKNKLAGAVAESKPAPEETKSQKATGTLATPKLDKPTAPAEGPKDVVKLSKTEEQPKKGDAKTDAKTFRNKLDALQEETLAREKSIKEASDRATALEKQIDDLQKLMTLKNKSMADAQKQAADVTKPQEPTKVAEVKKEEVKPATEEKKPEAVAKTEEAKAAEKPAAETADKPVEVAKPAEEEKKPEAVKKPKKHKAPKKVEEPAEEEGFLDSVDPVMLGGAGGLIAALGGGWFYLRNRRKQSLDSFEKGILTAGALKANTVFGNTSGGTVDTGDTSFLTDFSQTAGGMIDTHDVDPIAEAEVYMAYGREAQAEEILKDAISKEPTRYELHLKLLEIYASRNDSSAFEATAGELYTTLGATHPVWLKVAEMGHAMEPNNPLYDTASGAAVAAVSSTEETNPAPAVDMEATQILNVSDFAQAEELDDTSLDFSLDTPAESAVSATTNNAMDFEFPTAEVEEIVSDATLEELPALSEVAADDNSLDFQLDVSALEDATNTAVDTLADAKPDFEQTMPSMAAATFESPVFDSPVLEEVAAESSEPALETESGLDFNFDLGDTPVVEEVAEDQPDTSGSALSFDDAEITNIDMSEVDLGQSASQSSGAEGEESEDVNTKLDLVTAYIDMGDNEGAKELLDEIIKEGGPKQIARAKRLLADIS